MAKDKEEKGGRAIEPRQRNESQLGRTVTPFSFVQRMMADMDRLFSGGGSSFFDSDELALGGGGFPQVEVYKKNGQLVVRADLPGIDRNDVRVHLEEDAIVIEGERKSEQEDSGDGWYHSERSYGSFQRRIALPRNVDRASCDAVFENGVLEVKLKLPEERKQAVQIRGGGKQEQTPAEKPQQQETKGQNGPAPTARH